METSLQLNDTFIDLQVALFLVISIFSSFVSEKLINKRVFQLCKYERRFILEQLWKNFL